MPGKDKSVFFVINLFQDVNIVRGLVYLAARETDANIVFLISQSFLNRDGPKIWQAELAAMAADTRASMYVFGVAGEVQSVLEEHGGGLIFAASESNLPAHAETSDVFRVAPLNYLRITLQHGFECVGFLQSREHIINKNISFGADIVCSWFDVGSLTALSAYQRAKLYVTGPPTLLQRSRQDPDSRPQDGGLVCENPDSVRLRASGDHKTPFRDVFFGFCEALQQLGEAVTLRSHPGGQYMLKDKVELPENVRLDNLPIFDVNLKAYRFGISAPSTILFDMVLAGIPVAVWRGPGGVMDDVINYAGLRQISTLDEWLDFERDARLCPEAMLGRQAAFLRRLSMPMDPAEVYRRFARLIIAGFEGPPSELSVGRRTSTGPGGEAIPYFLEPSSHRPRRVTLAGNALVDQKR